MKVRRMLDAKIDHVALAVRSIRAWMPLIVDGLGADFLFGGDDERHIFRWAQFVFPKGGKIELLAPLGEGMIQKFLDQRGEGVHHISFKVDDIHAAIAHLQSQQVTLMDISTDDPHWKEAFIHPRDAAGTLIQIAQSTYSDEEAARLHLWDHSDLRAEDL